MPLGNNLKQPLAFSHNENNRSSLTPISERVKWKRKGAIGFSTQSAVCVCARARVCTHARICVCQIQARKLKREEIAYKSTDL